MTIPWILTLMGISTTGYIYPRIPSGHTTPRDLLLRPQKGPSPRDIYSHVNRVKTLPYRNYSSEW